MNKLLISLFMSFGLVAASHAAGDAAAGQGKAMVCGACHGMDGNSMVPNFPKLAGLGERYLLKQMQDIKGGARTVPEMTGLLDAFSDQDLADIAAFFNSQTRSLGAADAAKAEQGRDIFRAGISSKGVAACAACHSPTGQGNSPAGFPALSGQHADYIAKQLRSFRTGFDDPANPQARNNDGDSKMMRTVASLLSDKEIDAVASYIAGLRH